MDKDLGQAGLGSHQSPITLKWGVVYTFSFGPVVVVVVCVRVCVCVCVCVYVLHMYSTSPVSEGLASG